VNGRAYETSGSQPDAARNAAEATVAILRKAIPAAGTGGTAATGDSSLLQPIEIGKGATFKGHVIGKDVQGEEPPGSEPSHLKIGEGGVFEGPVTGKCVGGG
jgi:hypothetical protein